jgi:hypothetical protein
MENAAPLDPNADAGDGTGLTVGQEEQIMEEITAEDDTDEDTLDDGDDEKDDETDV